MISRLVFYRLMSELSFVPECVLQLLTWFLSGLWCGRVSAAEIGDSVGIWAKLLLLVPKKQENTDGTKVNIDYADSVVCPLGNKCRMLLLLCLYQSVLLYSYLKKERKMKNYCLQHNKTPLKPCCHCTEKRWGCTLWLFQNHWGKKAAAADADAAAATDV